MTDRVLVTGVSGFIGSHVAERLLAKGYAVRGTVRNKVKGQKIVDALEANGADVSRLELVEADLGADTGWADAVKDCRYIQHIASPLPHEAPKEREALVPEARAGAQRVLERGFSAGAERIVLTSSIAAMMGQPGKGAKMILTEDDWSDPDWKPMTSYPISKTRAEKSAWAYVEAQGLKEKLTTICPGVVFGPDTYGNAGASLGLLKAMMIGKFPRVPKVGVPLIDVRDCAAIHVAAMTSKEAGGRRLFATGESLWFKDIAATLRAEYPDLKGLPKGEMPSFVLRIIALFDDSVKALLAELGTFHEADAAYVSTMTHVLPRPAREAILAGSESLIASGSVRLN
ncbi:NAD-dependent epimerase/dehydratase family protein [Hellea balneolensis]|uniref:NAD-dependent epimerase/dehydratase family protein n=1 Tax=Hellea balneolensis TaxID=287478 RepID=UPI0003FAF80D|nr:NAD-dependent epimerase/dehydratase family protein [Hellea balneolensis]